MESDIILEGFKQAEEVHGVRYLRFIGDGDSSVYSTLFQDGGDTLRKWSVPITAASVITLL